MTSGDRRLVLRRVAYDPQEWEATVGRYPEADVYHGAPWLSFLKATQGAEPVTAEVLADGAVVGHFVGATVRRLGLRVLGSPLSGWGTMLMGFLLQTGVSRRAAVEALLPFAYGELGCAHVELGDRHVTVEDMAGLKYSLENHPVVSVDLTGSEEDVLAQARRRTRTYMRRGAKQGLRSELGSGHDFAEEYYDQLLDVFHSSGLTPTYPVERVVQLIDALEPHGQTTLVRLVDSAGNHLGTTVCIGRNQRAVMWGLAFYRQYSKLHPVEAMQWETMKALREHGYSSYLMYGNASYKSKFSEREEPPLVRAHQSRYPLLEVGRSAVSTTFHLRQRVSGRLARRAEARDTDRGQPKP